MSKIRINSELENSTTPGSIIVTDNSNEAIYVAPGSNGQVLTVVSGVPQYATPASGSGTLTGADNGLNVVSNVAKLGGPLLQDTTISGTSTSSSTGFELTLDTLKKFTANFENIAMNLDTSRFLHTTSNLGGGITYGNQFMGYQAGQKFGTLSTGYANTVYGRRAAFTLNGDNTNSSSNAVFGYGALESTQYSQRNTVLGVAAMGTSAVGTQGTPLTGNVAIGHHAYREGAGSYNIAIGTSALENQTTAINEIVAIGYNALKVNAGSFNSSLGYNAGGATTTGGKNLYLGWGAGQNNTTPTENTCVGYLAGGTGVGTSGYNTCIGSESGKAITNGNTNTFIGRASGSSVTSGISNTFIGNNSGKNGTVDVNTGSHNICIGNNTSISAVGASNELNIGNSIFGQNMTSSGTSFTTPRLSFGKRSTTSNSTLDMGLCILPIILPKTGTTPSVGLETGMLYYNTNTDSVDMYSGTATFMPICKLTPMSVVTSASGIAANSNVYKTVLNATSNAITQTISPATSAYKNVELVFIVVNSSVNTTTFNIPSSSYVNGVTGATSFVAANGAIVTCSCDGITWYITNK